MKLLLSAALKTTKHFSLLLITVGTLICLTLANQAEMFTLGILTNKGGTGKNPLGLLMDKLGITFDASQIEPIISLLVVVALFKAAALFFSRYCTQLFAIRVSRDLRESYFRHIQSLPMSFYHRYNIGTLTSRVGTDATQIAQSVSSFVTNYFQAPFTLVSTLFGCFYLSWQLSLIIFFGIPMVLLPIVLVTRKVKKITRELQKNQERFSSVLIDFLSGIQTVKIFAMERFSFLKYKEQNDQMAKLESKTAKYDLLTRPILHMITTICLSFVAIFGLYALAMPLSELFMFCGLLYLFYEPVKKFADENTQIQKGVVAAERLFEVLDLRPHIDDHPKAKPLHSFEKEIEFDRVFFSYGDEWVLKNLSFTVKKGETVAIVGATGAGKSTIVQLIPRLYDVQGGEIRIDGVNLTDLTQASLRNQIAFVPQKPFLFYDTIAANIAYGEDFSREEIIDAAHRAHASEFINRLPQGYDTLLEETGKNLSGGQQQRLAIARALIKKAPILILDEATSALDANSEGHIRIALQELKGQITQIIIAHRPSTIEHADHIIQLDYGEKIQDKIANFSTEEYAPTQ